MEFPRWLNSSLTRDHLDSITETLKSAEAKTTGEIVPMIVRRSIPLGHVPTILVLLLICALLLMQLISYAFFFHPIAPQWTILLALGLLALIPFLSQSHRVQRWLTQRREMLHLVESRALFEFYRNGLNGTREATGVLIFLSLTERRAIVLADKQIAQKIDDSQWQKIVTELVAHAHQKDLGRALCHAIEEVGKILAQHFPSQGPARNELKNQLLIRE